LQTIIVASRARDLRLESGVSRQFVATTTDDDAGVGVHQNLNCTARYFYPFGSSVCGEKLSLARELLVTLLKSTQRHVSAAEAALLRQIPIVPRGT